MGKLKASWNRYRSKYSNFKIKIKNLVQSRKNNSFTEENNNNDKVLFGYYINLKHRIDRKEHFENLKEKNNFFSNIERFEAINKKEYGVGCILSHIKCLQNLLKRDDDFYIILEDDFCILNQNNFNEFVKEFNNIKNKKWDIIVLTPRGKTKKKNKIKGFHKIIDNQTTTGYIIKRDFILKLLPKFEKASLKLMKDPNGKMSWRYCADQCWKSLQKKYDFLYFNKIYGGQLPSYSDIEKHDVDYNSIFLNQK